MLPRAALRATAPPAHGRLICTSPLLLPSSAFASPSLRLRSFATKKPPPPPPTGKSPRAPAAPRAKPLAPASGQARQTWPGTALPKDQTWKPKDGIKLAGKPEASTPSGAGQAAAAAGVGGSGVAAGAASPVQGARTEDKAASQAKSILEEDGPAADIVKMFQSGKSIEDIARYMQQLPPDQQEQLKHLTPDVPPMTPEQMQKTKQMYDEGKSWQEIAKEVHIQPQSEARNVSQEPTAQEPIAQKLDADEPIPGTARDVAQADAATAENTVPPAQNAPQEGAAAPGPLPDLRQGIPSTFDLEFGQAKGKAVKQDFATESQEDKLDLTSPEARRNSEEGEGGKQYDRSAYETSLDRRRARLANYFYAGIALSAALGAFYLGRPFGLWEKLPEGFDKRDASGWAPGKIYDRMRARLGSHFGHYTEPAFPKLLPDVPESQRPPFTLVLSLEDLMIHTTWDTKHGYRTAKRPGIDYFIRYLSQYYELVLFTSAPRAMADPIVAKLDPYHFITWPLGREATKYENGEYVKDLSYLNRDLKKTIIVDTHAPHVKNQPENAIVIPKWNGDPKDTHVKDLVALIPFLEYVATMGTDDVRKVLKSFEGQSIPEEFARREAIAREKFQQQLAEERRRRPKFSLGSIAGGLGVKGGSGMGGGMVLADGQSVAEGLAQGKMLSDQIREQGQKQYEFLEKQIRENGEQWLKEEAEEAKKAMEAQMKDMKKSAFSWFGGRGKE